RTSGGCWFVADSAADVGKHPPGPGATGTAEPPPVDLRSDTVTVPTQAMRRAMAAAEVGDDVYAEDPTVNRLQGLAAEMAGFEAGLFVASGTLGNQIAIAVHVRPGSEVVCTEGAHIYEYEPGSMALIASALPRLVPTVRGVPRPS